MSLAVRVVVANVFLYSLLSFQNKHFLMPHCVVRDVEAKILRFPTPVPWAKLRVFAHVHTLYGIRTRLQDLRFTNVAMLLGSYHAQPETMSAVLRSLEVTRRAGGSVQRLRRSRGDHRHPAVGYIRAHHYFRIIAASFPENIAYSYTMSPPHTEHFSTETNDNRVMLFARTGRDTTFILAELENFLGACQQQHRHDAPPGSMRQRGPTGRQNFKRGEAHPTRFMCSNLEIQAVATN